MKYYLGLDNGGTATKAALFTTEGEEIAVCSVSTPAISPAPSFVEQNMETMWAANCQVIQDVLRKSQADPKDILAVGVCGHGKGLYLWGKDGHPVRNGILSADNRAYAYPLRWKNDGTEKLVSERTCQPILACQPVSLLAWMRDNEPGTLEKTQWVFACKDYIRFRLTGEARAELTDYSGANLVNLYSRAYDRELLTLFGLDEINSALPPLCKATELCGKVTKQAAEQTGLCPGTPVIGGMFDIDACALAVGVADEEHICMIAGTWSINEYLRKEPIKDSQTMNSLFCIPEYYLIEESSPTSAGNHAWFIQQLLSETKKLALEENRDFYEEMNHGVEAIPPEEFVPIFLPFTMASNVHPNAKGSFVGISVNHSRAHLLRSLYEGVAFSHRYHYEQLMATRTSAPTSIRLAGGVARSKVWTQIIADVMQCPIETANVNETGALGCAVAASVAIGENKSLREAVNRMCRISQPVLPRKEYALIYNRKYQLYLKTIGCLDGLWDAMQREIEASLSPRF